MIQLEDFRKVEYSELKTIVSKRLVKCNKTIKNLCAVMDVTEPSIRSIYLNETQKVSDWIITTVVDILGIDAMIIWNKGKRFYYIK